MLARRPSQGMGQPLSILLGVDPATAHWPYAPCTIILPLLIQQQDQAADVSGIFFSVESAWNIVTPSPVGSDPSTVNRCKAYLTSRLSRRRGRKTDQKFFSVYNAVTGQVLMKKQALPMSQAPILEEVYCRHGVSSSLKFEVVLPLFTEAKPSHENLQFMLVAKHRHFSNMELHFLCFFPVCLTISAPGQPAASVERVFSAIQRLPHRFYAIPIVLYAYLCSTCSNLQPLQQGWALAYYQEGFGVYKFLVNRRIFLHLWVSSYAPKMRYSLLLCFLIRRIFCLVHKLFSRTTLKHFTISP